MEAGIDLPNVNTMLVDRADQFGVAQLYQLRGRVGRGHVRAQCLLLLPEHAPADARRRVQVLVENQGLGAGFQVAAADLEMRGAGNLLGEAQSGNIDAVGYETWLELLEEAVHQARGDLAASRVDTEIEVPTTALIPDAMVPDPAERLAWYRRISGAHSEVQVEGVLSDLEAERGELPLEVRNLGELVCAQLVGRELGIVSVRWLQVRVLLEVHPHGKVPRTRLDALASSMPRRFKVLDDTRLEARFTPEEAEQPIRFVRWLLARLRRE
jgi:transcription-repair coupling factor (superfamily II helicase)